MASNAARDKWIKEQLDAKGMADTAANRKTLGKQYDKTYVPGNAKDWRTYFKMQFGQLSGMFDGAEGEAEARKVFGDLIDLFIDVAENSQNYDLTTTAGQKAFQTKVEATQYAARTTESRAKWDALKPIEKDARLKDKSDELRAKYAGMGLTLSELNNLALQSLRDGRNDLELRYLAFSKLSERTGTLGETKEAMDLSATLKAYDYTFDNDMIEAALTGAEVNGVPQSAELLVNKARNAAMQKYSAFANLFEQGYTVNDVFEPYQQLASRILERPPTDVTYDKDMFRKALEFKNQDGSAMTMTEWSRILKSDDTYGFQYTNQARKLATDLVVDLEKTFGYRR